MNKTFILDMGSGNTCNNDWSIVKEMIDSIADIDKERHMIIKWQLFKEAGKNVPLDRRIFSNAYDYARKVGFQTTASVFDKESLDFLLDFDIPFVKLANNKISMDLVDLIPDNMNIILSTDKNCFKTNKQNISVMRCISQYPAKEIDYYAAFEPHNLKQGISDHTTSWNLYKLCRPKVYECHFKLEGSTGLDAGDFARTPKQLKHIIDFIGR
jgi:sialic acid synthase SpsE